MKFLGETSLKKLISLIKREIATKQNKITTNGILQCDGDGNISAASLDKNSVGLGNVGNFKAVSTAASQGLTATEKTNARTNIGAGTGTYSKPLTGIPKTDFASAVQASLDKADTALQSHQDISGKVDKVTGKGLSTNDFTTDEKNKLAGIATGANKTTVDSALSTTSTNPVQNKVINTALSGKANSSHTHKASDITSGVIPLDRGGTGSSVSLRDAPNGAIIRKLNYNGENLLWYTETKNGALYATSENGLPSFGTLPLAQGGTGSTSELVNAPRNAIVRKAGDSDNYLYYTATKSGALYASQENGSPVFGTLPLAQGGTGSSVSLRDAPNGAIIRKLKDDNDNELWYTPTKNGALYATSENGVASFGTLPIAQGGTGATSAAKARENLGAASSSHTHGAGDITGTLGIAHGGTGATTAADARNNLGAFSKSGGTLTGNVTISKDSNPFFKLQIGNNTETGIVQVYLPQGSSTQKMAVGFGSGKSIIVDDDGCLILTGAMYGTTLPAAGKKGRIFFKKV